MADSRSPVNTTKQAADAPELMLAEMMGRGGPSGAIESQEAAGQREMLFSDVLPSTGSEADEVLVELGFRLGPPNDDDPLFRACKLPPGWRREGSGHSMWSYIVDERGMRQVAIFYKAAFYDRRAEWHIEREPKTTRQASVIDTTYSEMGYPNYDIDVEMDGDVAVITATKLAVGEDGRPFREDGAWATTGDPVVRRIAMDGSET